MAKFDYIKWLNESKASKSQGYSYQPLREQSQTCYQCVIQSYGGPSEILTTSSIDLQPGSFYQQENFGVCGVDQYADSDNYYWFFTIESASQYGSGDCTGMTSPETTPVPPITSSDFTGNYTVLDDYFDNPTGFCADNPDVEYDVYWFITSTNMCAQCQNDPIQSAAIQCCCCPGYDGLPQQAIDYYAENNITFTAWGGPNQCDGTTLPSTLTVSNTGSIATGSIATGSINTGSFTTGSVTASGQPNPQGLPTSPTMDKKPQRKPKPKLKPDLRKINTKKIPTKGLKRVKEIIKNEIQKFKQRTPDGQSFRDRSLKK